MRVFGIAGYKNVGKTTLVVDLLRELRRRGLRVATLKHAHHEFDIDHPGKDSFLHREAGAAEVIVASARRWAHIAELDDQPEPSLAALLARFGAVDLVLVEGWKQGPHPRLELRRDSQSYPPLAGPDDPGILAIVADSPIDAPPVTWLDRRNVPAIADFIIEHAVPVTALSGGH